MIVELTTTPPKQAAVAPAVACPVVPLDWSWVSWAKVVVVVVVDCEVDWGVDWGADWVVDCEVEVDTTGSIALWQIHWFAFVEFILYPVFHRFQAEALLHWIQFVSAHVPVIVIVIPGEITMFCEAILIEAVAVTEVVADGTTPAKYWLESVYVSHDAVVVMLIVAVAADPSEQ